MMKIYEIKPLNTIKSQVLHHLAGTVFIGSAKQCDDFIILQTARAAAKASQIKN